MPHRDAAIPSAAPTSVSMPVTLTASSPAGTVALPSADGATTLELDVSRIVDPSGQAFAVRVSLRWVGEAGPSVVNLPPVSPYPPATPGAFVLLVPSDAMRAAAQNAATIEASLTLEPIAASSVLRDPLEIVASLRWRVP
jgi:hypothetical protein